MMNDKLDEILDLLKSQNEMIKDIHDYVKEVTSEKYIADLRMTSFSINLISSMTYLPEPDAFNVINIEKMHIILDEVNKIIDDNKDKLKNPTCATCVHLHDQGWAKRYGKVCCSVWQVCDRYINPNNKYNRKQKTYVRRPSNKACPNYEYGDDNFENRKKWLKGNIQ